MKKKIRPLIFTENVIAFILMILLSIIPLVEVIARKIFKTGVSGSSIYIQHIIVWITFIGGVITSRSGRHIGISLASDRLKGKTETAVKSAVSFISSMLITAFAWTSLSMVVIGFDYENSIGVLPIKAVAAVMPVSFILMAVRFADKIEHIIIKRIILTSGIITGTFLSFTSITNIMSANDISIPLFTFISGISHNFLSVIAIPASVIIIISAFFGTPIFIVLGGTAFMLFASTTGAPEVIANEAYTMLISHSIPSIPLFTLTGYILSESRSGQRLVSLFSSLLGWLPGGMIIMTVFVCACFTTFTGASGITILALGPLLSYIMINTKTSDENFSIGLITSSGSIGMLFPPSLPIILYGVVAHIHIKKMFIGGIIPGIILVSFLSGYGIFSTMKKNTERIPFDLKKALNSIKNAAWEIMFPIIILVCYFGGLTTIVETGAVAVIYSLFICLVVHKDFKVTDIPAVVLKSIPVLGGVMIILAMSRGLSYFIIDAEIPLMLMDFVKIHIESKLMFLILLNIFLLISGCFMDIFSAIMVIVPIIIPMGNLYGVDPVHLGIIFLANLGLGFLTPPVGLNLFLASYRFEKPVTVIYKNVIPFFLVMLVAVLLITYLPFLSTGLPGFFDF